MKVPLIEFRDVTKRFERKTVLNRVNLKIYENEITTIIGKSGTGKTVLLKHIIGLLRPDEGTILFRGIPVNEMKRSEWNEYKRQISYLFQHNALFDSMTVFENVALPLVQTTSLSSKEIEEKVMTRIEQTELTEAASRYPAELSGGMQKRAALARALVTDPKIVLFDEPTTGQDPIRKNVILSMIAQYRRKFGFTAVLISHDIPDVFFVSDRVVLLWEGNVGFEGTYEEAVRLDHPMIAEFLQSLEGLQDELTGLLSKESFRSCYVSLFSEGKVAPVTSAILFTLEFGLLAETLGTEAPVEVMEVLGEYTARHFRPLGGFSARYSKGEILTVLPHTTADEAEQLMMNYADELEQQALLKIESMSSPRLGPNHFFEVRVKGGTSEVSFKDDIDNIVQKTKTNQRIVATYRVDQGDKKP
ncbi:MAG: putative phospholipid import ATP-binding protein MlaF [Syntrophorhabdaceae bacterium PtaU1.Bin034]|nr:MAG: putative phospholipid import ATP-binding protein MlaF [Syntrophorhabdaceae bacterium PtaU1.Bin034]